MKHFTHACPLRKIIHRRSVRRHLQPLKVDNSCHHMLRLLNCVKAKKALKSVMLAQALRSRLCSCVRAERQLTSKMLRKASGAASAASACKNKDHALLKRHRYRRSSNWRLITSNAMKANVPLLSGSPSALCSVTPRRADRLNQRTQPLISQVTIILPCATA
jgi:hypothetical protein